MDENKLRSALRVIASDPEPPTTIDVAAARRRGCRRQRVRHVLAPVAVALAAAAVIVPVTQFRGAPGPALTTPTRAPATFNPLVPYAAFGWLPAGFTESLAPAVPAPVSTASELKRMAATPNGQLLSLFVYPRGACTLTTSVSADAAVDRAGKCAIDVSGTTAASVSGRPARMYRQGAIAWEYAAGAWATIASGTVPGRGAVPRAVPPAQLHDVAAHVKFGQQQPIVVPYHLSGPLPAGWQVRQVAFRVSGKALVGTYALDIGPAADPTALEISTWWPASFSKPADNPKYTRTHVTKYGVTWDYVTGPDGSRRSAAISTAGSAATAGSRVWIAVHVPSPLGDPFAVFHRMTLLGADPAAWTSRPLG